MFIQINMMYACITVLRALALQDGPSQVWRDYTNFESHLEERMKTEVYTKVQVQDALILNEVCPLGQQREGGLVHPSLPQTVDEVQRFGNPGNLRKIGEEL